METNDLHSNIKCFGPVENNVTTFFNVLLLVLKLQCKK